ncbi:hypothetical protein BH10ACI1_BH10ACI1_08390 [soil metagenome]
MKKLLLLIAVAAFCLNCGTKTNVNVNTAANNTTANKPSPTGTVKPANTTNSTSNTNASTNTSSKTDETSNPELDFTIVNKTGYAIKELSIGATGTGDWAKEDEVLKGRTFADGTTMDIKFNPRAKAEFWDIKVEWADGSKGVEWLKLNLTEIEKLTLVYDKDKDETSAIIE